MNRVELHHGDCLETLRTMPDNSVDSIVTDPPYGLEFMGKRWDYDVPSVEIWAECLRVLKPGGHLLAFAGTRTQHRMAVRIEDAGFEIRDMIAWVYGSGFPKSLDVSKAIDKAAGAEREVVGIKTNYHSEGRRAGSGANQHGVVDGSFSNPDAAAQITTPATEAAQQWQGWGTALKPALEPITVARKPLAGTVASNVLEWGTGALNIDGCRIGHASDEDLAMSLAKNPGRADTVTSDVYGAGRPQQSVNTAGRWPANLIHDGSEEVLAGFPATTSGKAAAGGHKRSSSLHDTEAGWGMRHDAEAWRLYGDAGSAARFFYCAKANRRDRDEGLDHLPKKSGGFVSNTSGQHMTRRDEGYAVAPRANNHPTVKPTDLMRYLCRLVTPPGGLVLDPFMGSGSTGKAALREGFRFVGIEREAQYLEIARARIEAERTKPQPDLFSAALSGAEIEPGEAA